MTKTNWCLLVQVLTAAAVILISQPVMGESFFNRFVDPTDGYVDASEWLLKDRMFLPVPIIITEPAVGYGAGAALVFFHELNKPTDSQADGKKRPPVSASALFGGGTENGTWFAGAGHQGSYRDDTLRYNGSLFYPSVNLKFYGGGDTPSSDRGIEYNLEGWATIHDLLFRVVKSPFLIGPRLTYFGATSTFKTPEPITGIDQLEMTTKNLGIGIKTIFDTRDNLFSPLSGWNIEFTAMAYNGESTFEYDYSYFDFHPRGYWDLNEIWGVAWRFQGEYASGEVPFYALPDITLRGIPAMRYQGSTTVVTEGQVDWKLSHRWTILAFTGVGTTADEIGNLGNNDNYWAGGIGFRYLTARVLGLQTGIDIAVGPEQAAIYLQMGNAWNY